MTVVMDDVNPTERCGLDWKRQQSRRIVSYATRFRVEPEPLCRTRVDRGKKERDGANDNENESWFARTLAGV